MKQSIPRAMQKILTEALLENGRSLYCFFPSYLWAGFILKLLEFD